MDDPEEQGRGGVGSVVRRLAESAIAAGGRILGLSDQAVADTVIRRYYRALPASGRRHLVDVGAAYGSVAELFLQDGWSADLFEPDPACRHILQRLLAAHGGRARLFPFAAAAEDRESVPFQRNSTLGLSGLSPSPFGTPLGTMPVRTVRLGSFLLSEGVSRVDFLKIDTEGNDFVVLDAYDFARLPPSLVFVEFSYYFAGQDESLLRRAIASMKDRGYSAVIFEYDDDGNFKRGNWNHRLVGIHVDGARVPTRPEAFGNVLFFRHGDLHLPEALAAAIRDLTSIDLGLVDIPFFCSPPHSPAAKVADSLAATRRELASQWIALPSADVERHYADRLGRIHRLIFNSGLREAPQSAADRTFIDDLKVTLSREEPRRADPGKLLAAMLFLFPHEMPHAYEATAVPQWLLRDYMPYMLAGPPMFREIGEAAAYCDFVVRWTTYLHDGVLANINADFWRNVGLLFTQTANFIPLYFNAANLRDVYRKRAVLMEATLRVFGNPLDHVFGPRPNRRRLRLGILAAHYSPQTETYATLPVYRHLDRTKFEVVLFSLQQTNHPLEQFCARHADRFEVLPQQPGPRLQALRAADLDLIFLGTNTTAVTNDITILAMHRLARVQVASVCSCATTGMRNTDYYLSGSLNEPADAQSHYTEKLIMLEGSAHCYDFAGEPPPTPSRALTRQDLGIPGDAVVFVSGANFYKILPEVEETWIRILSAVPESRLVLYPFNPNWSSAYPVGPFIERLTASMARHNVDRGRLFVFGAASSKADVHQRLRLGDVYLDSFPFSGATSLLDPLEVGLPAVAMDGTSFRTLVAAALLREMSMEELIVGSLDAYVELAVKLAADAALRTKLRALIRERMEAVPRFLDSRRYGEQVGAAFERMWKGYEGRQ